MVMYWLENQVALAFHSDVPFASIGDSPSPTDPIIKSLQLPTLNLFLQERGFKLKPFRSGDIPHPPDSKPEGPPDEKLEELEGKVEELEEEIEKLEKRRRRHLGSSALLKRKIEALEGEVEALEREIEKREATRHGESAREEAQEASMSARYEGDDPNSPIGKYFFPSPSDQGTIVIGFFNIVQAKTFHPIQDPASITHSGDSHTRHVVDLINRNLDTLQMEGKIPISAAMPNWLGGATCVTHGCPVVPPFPVPGDTSCPNAPGFWPITLPELSPDLQQRKGEGITVFVLDTMPDIVNYPDLVDKAARGADTHNLLLKEIAAEKVTAMPPHINFRYLKMCDLVAEDAPDQIVTGRDIYGHLYGFNMPDHGMSIVGIIRDLAPRANIEYIRALNDFGVGDTDTLIYVLQYIQQRMSVGGDLYNKPVVINLSLVVTPHDEDLPRLWFGDDCSCDSEEFIEMMDDIEKLRLPLHRVIQSLYALGAVIVSSAGNDSGVELWHGPMGGTMPERVGPRYPAAFPEVIAVGAVDGKGNAAPYSNYPALPPNHNGIATYGGGLPTPVPPSGSDPFTEATNIDSLRAIYIAPFYPALSAEDSRPNKPAPDPDPCWAYWSGTSFATPIISAVAARVLEKITSGPNPLSPHLWSTQVQWALTAAAGQQAILTGGAPLPLQPDFSSGAGTGVSLLKAYQCEEKAEI